MQHLGANNGLPLFAIGHHFCSLRLSWAKMLFDVDGVGVEIQVGCEGGFVTGPDLAYQCHSKRDKHGQTIRSLGGQWCKMEA